MKLYPDRLDPECVVANLLHAEEWTAEREKEALDYARLHDASFVLCWRGERCFKVMLVSPNEKPAAA